MDHLDEKNALRAMLGMPSEPVFLDIKPPLLLTSGERKRLYARLEAIQQAPEPEPDPPKSWWPWHR